MILPPADPSSAFAPAAGRLPDFAIIGAMKAGTTSLRAYLDAHPQVFSPPETHFFTRNYERGLDWYREQFAGAGEAVLIGDKTPDYMHTKTAMERMAAALPEAKLMAILRDPIDRAYSHYWHMRRVGREGRPFEEAIEAELERNGVIFNYVDHGRYLVQLERVCSLYPRSNLLVLLFDDLAVRPVETFAEACRFLGIDDTVIPPIVGERTNTYRVYRSRRLWAFMMRRRMWRLARLLHGVLIHEASYPPMSPGARARLRAAFASDNAALGGWLGRDLSNWDA